MAKSYFITCGTYPFIGFKAKTLEEAANKIETNWDAWYQSGAIKHDWSPEAYAWSTRTDRLGNRKQLAHYEHGQWTEIKD